MRKFISFMIAVILLLTLAACGEATPTPSPLPQRAYEMTKGTFENEETSRTVAKLEFVPTSIAENEKVPIVILIHGATGNCSSLAAIARMLVNEKVAAMTIECCGATDNSPLSDGADIFVSHYSSRVSDTLAAVDHALTLDYVDTSKVYLLGESYGGLTSMIAAPICEDKIDGVFLVSTCIHYAAGESDRKGVIEKYVPQDPYEYIKGYGGDILYFNGTTDDAWENAQKTVEIYNTREEGSCVLYTQEGSGHSFSAFSADQKTDSVKKMVEFISAR